MCRKHAVVRIWRRVTRTEHYGYLLSNELRALSSRFAPRTLCLAAVHHARACVRLKRTRIRTSCLDGSVDCPGGLCSACPESQWSSPGRSTTCTAAKGLGSACSDDSQCASETCAPLVTLYIGTNSFREVAGLDFSDYRSACTDNNNGATDELDNGCDLYDANPSMCGLFDDSDFNSDEMCCACSPASCADKDNGATGQNGSGCSVYDSTPSACGSFDDADFSANTMCCACSDSQLGWHGHVATQRGLRARPSAENCCLKIAV